MKLKIESCGPIDQAKDIRIKPLTVFVGPNHTGKSFLATLIYSTLGALQQLRKSTWQMAEGLLSQKASSSSPRPLQPAMDYAWGLADKIRQARYASGGDTQNAPPPQAVERPCTELVNAMNSPFRAWAAYIRRDFDAEMARCLGQSKDSLFPSTREDAEAAHGFRIYSKEPALSLNLGHPRKSFFNPQVEEHCKYLLNLMERAAHITLRHLGNRAREGLKESVGTREERVIEAEMLGGLIAGFYEPFAGYLQDLHYLPAGRAMLIQHHKLLSQALPEPKKNNHVEKPPLNGISSDFLRKLLYIGDKTYSLVSRETAQGDDWYPQNPLSRVGYDLERYVINGHIGIKLLEKKIPDFYYLPKVNGQAQEIPIAQSTGLVAGLAPLAIFIRYHLKRDSVLIIEEPEAHLHPAEQRRIAEVLVQLSMVGLRVLITTHSSIILEQLSNFVHASQLKKGRRKGARLLGEPLKGRALPEQNIAVYNFTRGAKGSLVQAVPFDEEKGFIPPDHLETTLDLQSEFIDLLSGKD